MNLPYHFMLVFSVSIVVWYEFIQSNFWKSLHEGYEQLKNNNWNALGNWDKRFNLQWQMYFNQDRTWTPCSNNNIIHVLTFQNNLFVYIVGIFRVKYCPVEAGAHIGDAFIIHINI